MLSLFETFQRVDTPDRALIGGAGLGLYIARQLVDLNGGSIWAENNRPPPGCTFRFTLPLAAAPARRRRTGPTDQH
jgi:two-component system sensor histidine kinase VicK